MLGEVLSEYLRDQLDKDMRALYEAFKVNRLKTTEVKPTRDGMYLAQAGRCAICKFHIVRGEDVLDHDHATGAVRAVLHRSCNALLGKVENNYRRHGVKNLAAWAHGVPDYLQHHAVNRTGLLHPTHKTDEEKRLRRNKRARVARARKAA
jgi:Autographiviridae endonuclease VII